jgi:hypothetical protein
MRCSDPGVDRLVGGGLGDDPRVAVFAASATARYAPYI